MTLWMAVSEMIVYLVGRAMIVFLAVKTVTNFTEAAVTIHC